MSIQATKKELEKFYGKQPRKVDALAWRTPEQLKAVLLKKYEKKDCER